MPPILALIMLLAALSAAIRAFCALTFSPIPIPVGRTRHLYLAIAHLLLGGYVLAALAGGETDGSDGHNCDNNFFHGYYCFIDN